MLIIILLFTVSLVSFLMGIYFLKSMFPTPDYLVEDTDYDQSINYTPTPFEF